MGATVTITLGVALITQCFLSITCQDLSSEEDNLANRLKQYKACSTGYCIPKNQCVDGIINTDGENLLEIRINDYDDMIPIDIEQQEDTCEFLTTCCAMKSGLRSGPTEPDSFTTDPPPSLPTRCGTNHPYGYVYRVNNSAVAQFGEFPWMVALLRRSTLLEEEKLQYFCGGSLIHPKVVLTAAHCVQQFANVLDTLTVRLGEWDTVTEREPIIHQQYGVQKMIVHEHYVDKKFHNDLALLIMEESAELNVNVNTICLPLETDRFDDQRCLVSGWGRDNFDPEGKFAEVLKRVELPVVPRRRCESMLRATKLGQIFQLHSSFICAGGEFGVDACKGDGGSPLACKSGDQYVQAGIVAWGIGCGKKDVPAGYVKVSSFVDWIGEKLQKEGIQISN